MAPRWTDMMLQPAPLPTAPAQAQPPPRPAWPLAEEVKIANGGIEKAAIGYRPWGLTVEAGVLGLDAPNAVMAPSPYVNIRESLESSPDAGVDWRAKFSAGVVDLSANYFGAAPADSAGADALGSSLANLANDFHIPSSDVLARLPRTSDPYQDTRVVVTSAMGQLGRAYTLGVVDVGWAATALLKTSSWFPNAAGDASVGARAPVAKGQTLSVTAGMTENASPAGESPVVDMISGSGQGLNLEPAPHAGVSYRGQVLDGGRLTVGVDAQRQWGRWLVSDELRGSVASDALGVPAELGATWRRDEGPAIEYERDRRRVDVGAQVSPTVQASLGWQSDKFQYGAANLSQGSAVLGVRISLDGGDRRAELEIRPTPQDTAGVPGVPDFRGVTDAIDRQLAQGLQAAYAAEKAFGIDAAPVDTDPKAIPGEMDDLADTIAAFTPDQRDALLSALLSQGLAPQQAQWATWLLSGDHQAQLAATLRDGAEVLRLLQTDGVLEAYATNVARGEMIRYLDSVNFQLPVVGQALQWSPAMNLAAAQALSSRPSGLAPVTAADAQNVFQPWLWNQLAAGAGLPAGSSPAQIAAALASKAPPPWNTQIQQGGPAAVQALVGAVSDLARQQLDLMLAQALVAAEQLDRLTADEGRKAGQLAGDMLEASYRKNDQRRLKKILGEAAARLLIE